MSTDEDEVVQDDSRELQIAEYCGLKPTRDRAGVDAHDDAGNPFELKSATKGGVTTARDVGLHTIRQWRSKYWMVAVGRNLSSGFDITALYIAHPKHLEPRFAEIEAKLQKDSEAAAAVIRAARSKRVPPATLERAQYLLSRGTTLNNPKIPIAILEKGATAIPIKDKEGARRAIRDFVKRHPLKT